MPTYKAHFTQTETKRGTLKIEAPSRLNAILQARHLNENGDENEEIDWEADGDYDTSFESVDSTPQ